MPTGPDTGDSNDQGAAAAEQKPAPTPKAVAKAIHLNIAYVPNGNLHQRLDLYLPKSGSAPYPTILA